MAHAHIVTTTTHKSLRGPRGGMVLCVEELAEHVDRGCPLVLGGPLSHVMAAKAVAFAEARRPEFRDYAQRVVDNAQALAEGLLRRGGTLVTGGTDNHLVLVDVSGHGLTGRQAEAALLDSGIVTNRNSVPGDPNGAWYTSGVRIGTPALTTRGLGTAEMDGIAGLIDTVLRAATPATTAAGCALQGPVRAGPGGRRGRREARRRPARLLPALPGCRPGLTRPGPPLPARPGAVAPPASPGRADDNRVVGRHYGRTGPVSRTGLGQLRAQTAGARNSLLRARATPLRRE